MKIGYLGPEATFTHEAAVKYFSENEILQPRMKISDIFYAIASNEIDYGVVPAENSTGGSVSDTLDLFIETDVKIYDQLILEIRQTFLSNAKDIKRIYSKEQSFYQCGKFLRDNYNEAEFITMFSNAAAAERAVKDEHGAAIGPVHLSSKYGLGIVNEFINDKDNNQTKFYIVSNEVRSEIRSKSLILFSVPNESGALLNVLSVLKKHNVNMTKIESRPSKRKNWEYVFIVEFENKVNEEETLVVLNEFKNLCSFYDFLGTY